MSNRYIGSTEERINKWMRLCLHYQFDKKLGQAKKLSYYCKKYHVGKYAKKWFDDIVYSVVDREYVINKMNLISEDRMKRDRKLGLHSNRVLIKQIDVPNYNIKYKIKGVKINDNTILKNVAKSKLNLSDVSTINLVEELQRRTVGEA